MLGWRIWAPYHREEYWNGCVAENNSLITWILSPGGDGICKVWYISCYNPPTKGILLKMMASLKHVLEPKDKSIRETPYCFVSILLPPVAFSTFLLLPALALQTVWTQLRVEALICGYLCKHWPLCSPIRALKNVLQGNIFVLLSSMNRLPFFF